MNRLTVGISPHHPILEYPQPALFTRQEPSLMPTQNKRRYTSVHRSCVFEQKRERRFSTEQQQAFCELNQRKTFAFSLLFGIFPLAVLLNELNMPITNGYYPD
jgi:hypothetical protein